MEPTLTIADCFGGFLSPTELLKPEGSFQFGVPGAALHDDGCIVSVLEEDYVFVVAFKDGGLHFLRNHDRLTLTETDLRPLVNYEFCHVIAGWSRNNLVLSVFPWDKNGPHCVRELATPPTCPPKSLIEWARRKALIPISVYDSDAAFYQRVFHALGAIEGKIADMPNANCFWDIHYEGNRIVERKPKKERDLHPVVHSLLSDHFFLSSVEVVPEYHTSDGDLDFMLMGSTKSGLARICAEFKTAHSPDLYRGIEEQLPRYMSRTKCEVGVYCVFDFRGEWFDLPKERNPHEIQA